MEWTQRKMRGTSEAIPVRQISASCNMAFTSSLTSAVGVKILAFEQGLVKLHASVVPYWSDVKGNRMDQAEE